MAATPQVMQWLKDHGGPEQAVALSEMEVDGSMIDITVAARDVAAGETVLRIPDKLVVTLAGVFEDETVAELLTTDKLSELACLTLYLMCAFCGCLPTASASMSCSPPKPCTHAPLTVCLDVATLP